MGVSRGARPQMLLDTSTPLKRLSAVSGWRDQSRRKRVWHLSACQCGVDEVHRNSELLNPELPSTFAVSKVPHLAQDPSAPVWQVRIR